MSNWSGFDIEMAFIREFSVHGANLGGALSRDSRRDRVRLEILRHQREKRRFHDSGMTYQQAFQACYNQSLSMRGAEPVIPIFVEDEMSDDEFA